MSNIINDNFYHSYENLQKFNLPTISQPKAQKPIITLPIDILNSISIEQKIKVLAANNLSNRSPYKKAFESIKRGGSSVTRDISHIMSRQKRSCKQTLLTSENAY